MAILASLLLVAIAPLAVSHAEVAAAPQAPADIRDSSGVRIVLSRAPSWTQGREWRLSAKPVLVIRSTDDQDSVRFWRTEDVVRLSNGTIVVGSAGSFQLLFFDRRGNFVRAVGRKGQGPEDFPYILRIHVLAGDTLLVETVYTGRDLRRLAPNGAFVRTVRLPGPPVSIDRRGGPQIVGVLNDRAMVGVMSPIPLSPQGLPTTPRWQGTSQFVLLPFDGQAGEERGVGPAEAFFRPGAMTFYPRIVFGAYAVATAARDQYCTAFPVRYQIDCHTADGRLVRSLRRSLSPKRVTAAERAEYAEYVERVVNREQSPSDQGQRWRMQNLEVLEHKQFAETLPFFRVMRFDRVGHMWVRQYRIANDETPLGGKRNSPDAPTVWSIFAPDGRWLGDLTLPARFVPTDIGADYVLGLAFDDDDVESVAMYSLERYD